MFQVGELTVRPIIASSKKHAVLSPIDIDAAGLSPMTDTPAILQLGEIADLVWQNTNQEATTIRTLAGYFEPALFEGG